MSQQTETTGDQGTQQDYGQLKSDLASLKTDFSKLASGLLSSGKGGAAGVQQQLTQKYDDARQYGQDALSSFEYKVAEQPLKSVAIAAAVGAFVALLLKR